MATTKKRYVTRILPEGDTREIKAQRSELQASRWAIPEAPRGEAFAGRVYLVAEDTAAKLVRDKGWVYCDVKGTPTGETAPALDETTDPRAGTKEWYDHQLDERLKEAKAVQDDIDASNAEKQAADQARQDAFVAATPGEVLRSASTVYEQVDEPAVGSETERVPAEITPLVKRTDDTAVASDQAAAALAAPATLAPTPEDGGLEPGAVPPTGNRRR